MNNAYLYAVNANGASVTPNIIGECGFGWSGVASDGGSMSCAGAGVMNWWVSGAVTTSPPGVLLATPGSLEAWVVPGDPQRAHVLGFYLASEPANQQLVGFTRGGNHYVFQYLTLALTNAPTLGWGAWHHLVLTWDSGGYDAYYDGSHVARVTASLSNPNVAETFVIGQWDTSPFSNQMSGFIAEVAIYPTALSAGQVANHFAAADSASNLPVFYGTRPEVVATPLGYALGPAHLGLTGTGSISLAGGTVAALISVTTDAPQYGAILGDPDYLLSRGYVTASNSLGSVYEFNRLVFGTQVRQLPRFTSLLSWSFPAGLVVSITELFVH